MNHAAYATLIVAAVAFLMIGVPLIFFIRHQDVVERNKRLRLWPFGPASRETPGPGYRGD